MSTLELGRKDVRLSWSEYLESAESSTDARAQTDNRLYSFELALRSENFSDFEVRKRRIENHSTAIQEASLLELGKIVSTDRESYGSEFQWLGRSVLKMLDSGYQEIVQKAQLEDSVTDTHLNRNYSNEASRRLAERQDEAFVAHNDVVQQAMLSGKKRISVSPSPHHSEMDPDIAQELGYDGRLMIRERRLASNENQMLQQTWMLFDVSHETIAAVNTELFEREFDPRSSLATMEAFSGLEQHGLKWDIDAIDYIKSLVRHARDESERQAINEQLEAFLDSEQQQALDAISKGYAAELVSFEDDMIMALDRGVISTELKSFARVLADSDNLGLEERLQLVESGLLIDDVSVNLAPELFMKIWLEKFRMTQNAASLMVENRNAVGEANSKHGQNFAPKIKQLEYERLSNQLQGDQLKAIELMDQRDRMLIDAGLSCQGGCAIRIEGSVSKEIEVARKAGVTGTLYESRGSDSRIGCSCAKRSDVKKIYNGRIGICTSCGRRSDGRTTGTKATKDSHLSRQHVIQTGWLFQGFERSVRKNPEIGLLELFGVKS